MNGEYVLTKSIKKKGQKQGEGQKEKKRGKDLKKEGIGECGITELLRWKGRTDEGEGEREGDGK